MTEDEAIKRMAIASEQVASNQASHLDHLEAEKLNRQISMERSVRQSALSAAVALAGIFKYESTDQVMEAATEFLGWLTGGSPRLN